MQAAVAHRAALEADLRRGLERGELVLHYQAVVNHLNAVIGVEALVRWQHPERGLVPPNDFIPVAEQTGLILPLGEWVLVSACKQLVAWAGNPLTRKLSIAVNISAREFHQTDFVRRILDTVTGTGCDPNLLKLELTETLLLDDIQDAIRKMNELRKVGVRFSLDDFGTGYSSMSYLKQLPLDELKIDQSFVRDVLSDPSDAAIARTIVTLAHSLGLSVVAEGVETSGQRSFLLESGCKLFQGFSLGRPAPVAEIHLDRTSMGFAPTAADTIR
jgi:EAL domain-containing protein (putative c-di-GMP-specific phosphodiesterase class I)